MPRSRSISIVSSTCSRISRASSPPQAWISRSASVDLPWSIWAMIAKLRIWLSGVVMRVLWAGPEHKDATRPDQREPGLRDRSQRRDGNAQRLCRRDQPPIVARELDRFTLLAQVLGGREMQRVQSADGSRKRL